MASANYNPWADQEPTAHETGRAGVHVQQSDPSQNPWQLPGSNQQHPAFATPQNQDPWSQQQGHSAPMHQYSAPQGRPPTMQQQQQQPQAPTQANDLDRFVPDSERGEQREALEQFEMSRSRQLSSDDQNIETLTQQFPSIDSALVAAIYSDSKDMGASREMLIELAEQMKADGS